MNSQTDVSNEPPDTVALRHAHHVRVNSVVYELADATPTGEQVLQAAGLRPAANYALLEWPGRGTTREVGLEDVLDLTRNRDAEYLAVEADGVRYFIVDDERFAWAGTLDAKTVRRIGRLDPHVQIWLEKQDEPDVQLSDDDAIDLTVAGVERLHTRKATWKLDVQGELTEWDTPSVRVRDALLKAGYDLSKPWDVKFKVAGEPIRPVELDDLLDLSQPGVERLRVAPRNVTNGDGASGSRRDFGLLPDDAAFLGAAGFEWTTVNDGQRWLIIDNYPLPAGYSAPSCRLAVEIPIGYPTAPLDMFYCDPVLTANGAAPDRTEHRQSINGTVFQRWSRHRAAGNEWDPERDDLAAHFALIEYSLGREVGA